jgi:hypothetical protein
MALRPDLNGLRVQEPGHAEIYLIDEGRKRHIPNPPTYDDLFRNWEGVQPDLHLDEIDTGAAISDGAILAFGKSSPAVYLVDRGHKRHVTSPGVMDKYYFYWPTTRVDQILLDSIPDGNPIT